jgi:putative oxidoreductase
MNMILMAYCQFNRLSHALLTPALPVLARLVFAGSLLVFFINSAFTKFGDHLFSPSIGGYAQILPGKAAATGYNPAAFSWFDWLIVMAGTYGEIILPLLIVLGLFTRLAAAGMLGFIVVMTLVDVTGHGVAIGRLFDHQATGILDQRLFWGFLLVTLMATGGGKISLDGLLERMRSKPA